MIVGDLWPVLTGFDVRATPLSVLREQARLLGTKSSGKLMAELVTFPVGSDLRHAFEIVAPSLGGYRFQLFSITHPPELYPMTAEIGGKTVLIRTEAEFETQLREVLSSDRTRKILANLLSQVDALAA